MQVKSFGPTPRHGSMSWLALFLVGSSDSPLCRHSVLPHAARTGSSLTARQSSRRVSRFEQWCGIRAGCFVSLSRKPGVRISALEAGTGRFRRVFGRRPIGMLVGFRAGDCCRLHFQARHVADSAWSAVSTIGFTWLSSARRQPCPLGRAERAQSGSLRPFRGPGGFGLALLLRVCGSRLNSPDNAASPGHR